MTALTLNDLLRTESRWSQFQLYGIFDGGLDLMLAAPVHFLSTHESGRLALNCPKMFRRSGERWERLPVVDLFLVPGRAEHLDIEMTGLGRALLLSKHPKESVLTVLFAKDDPGGAEPFDPTLEKVNLETIATSAREEHGGWSVTNESGDLVRFACGHTGHATFTHTIFGREFVPREAVLAAREKCGQCLLGAQVVGIGRCHACRGPILNGMTYYRYEDDDGQEQVFCKSARCSPGPMGDFPRIWSGPPNR